MRYSFTLIEATIVIVTIGILAISLIPILTDNKLLDATQQVVRHIKYTQHLAMVNDVYDNTNSVWYKSLWRISFRSKNCYVVSSNVDFDMNYDRDESAFDPVSKLLLYSNVACKKEATDNRQMFIGEYFGIDKIEFSSSCGDNRFIAFDNYGRPHRSLINATDILTDVCEIKLAIKTELAVISIYPETGYTKYEIVK